MNLYQKLLKDKKAGKDIKLKDLGYEELYTLYIKQRICDREIAELCNCKKESVSSKRSKLGVHIFYRNIEDMNELGEMLRGFDI